MTKTVWITGASSGIGYALARLLARNHYHVIATARNLPVLEALADEYANITALAADLSNGDDIDRLRGYFSIQDKAIDIVIVNAGTCLYMDNAALNIGHMEEVFRINVFAAANTVDVALPHLKKSIYGGHIIGISSMSVYVPFSRAEYYGASKAAFTYYLQSLAIDLKPTGIDVSVVFPGFVETPLTGRNDFRMPFMVSADVAAQALLKVIKKRPATSAFPEPLHYLLRIFSIFPVLWSKVHGSSVSNARQTRVEK